MKTPEIWNGSTWRPLTGAVKEVPYYPRMFVVPNNRAFMAGEGRVTRYISTAGNGSWTYVADRIGGTRSYGSAVMYAPGKIMYAGGGDPPTQTVEVIDLNQASPSWRQVAGMAYPRRQMNATLLADGKVLVTHGSMGAGFNNEAAGVRDAELWDPVSGDLDHDGERSGGADLSFDGILLLQDGRVLSSGSGDAMGGTDQRSAQIFTPPYLFAPDGSLAPRADDHLGTRAPELRPADLVESPDAGTITKGSLMRLSSVTHSLNETQRLLPLTFTSSGPTTLVATAPADAILAPAGPYMLFLLNGNGVPSVAKMMLVGP